MNHLLLNHSLETYFSTSMSITSIEKGIVSHGLFRFHVEIIISYLIIFVDRTYRISCGSYILFGIRSAIVQNWLIILRILLRLYCTYVDKSVTIEHFVRLIKIIFIKKKEFHFTFIHVYSVIIEQLLLDIRGVEVVTKILKSWRVL